MSEPLRYTYTKEEMSNGLKAFMKDLYGDPKEMSPEDRNAYHAKLGLMYSFVCEMFPE